VRKVKVILALIVFALMASTVWQIASCELANYEFKDDLKDMASMGGARIGLAAQGSNDDLRAKVMHKAAVYGIALNPEQITVERSGTEEAPVLFLAAKYRTRVWLPGMSLIFHFTATSR
jgi:hypothetical protein